MRHTPFDGIFDENVKRLCLQIRWFPFEETSCGESRLLAPTEGKAHRDGSHS